MIERTKCGFFTRHDEFGLEIFSPYSGLFFRVPKKDSDTVLEWLNGKNVELPVHYLHHIGWCWKPDANLSSKFMLPGNPVDINDHIVAINWLITGDCNLRCKYCYASDVFGVDSTADISTIAENILSYSPLAVVISGGEPLMHPNFKEAILALEGRTGIILDTNGILLDKETASWLKDHNVVVRISLDSLIPRNNRLTRPSDLETVSRIIESINICLEIGLSLVIHTVVNKYNLNDLRTMGIKFGYLGVKVWKLIKLVDLGDKNVSRFVIDFGNEKYLKLKFIDKNSGELQMPSMSIQINEPRIINCTVLVLPDGRFVTQSRSGGKVLLDPNNPFLPRADAIPKRLDMWEHYRRYIIDL